jgi:nucleoside phosphorylase
MERRQFDIGIVVPLKEEFRYVTEILPQLDSVAHAGTYFYRLDVGRVSAVACIVGQMGPVPAVQATTRLLEFADVKLVVLLGLGGSLDNEVVIGDVVVAAEVNEFQANSKAESAGDGYEVRYSGKHWQLEFRIREAIGHFEFSGKHAYDRWVDACSADYSSIEVANKERVCSSTAKLHLGTIASGSVVVASDAFASELRRINRKFVAIDMEAAGVAHAAAERVFPSPCLVIRGISDRADEHKTALDQAGRGAWRRYCVRNAASLLRQLLTWEGFLTAVKIGAPASTPPEDDSARGLAARLKDSRGGPWIVGVGFGIYLHGPHVAPGAPAVPMDLSRLRIMDTRIAELLDGTARQVEAYVADGNSERAANALAQILSNYREKVGSVEVDALLADFDSVVLGILFVDVDGERVDAVLAQATRLEEESGPDAAIQLLAGVARDAPRLRERYVDTLATVRQWQELVDVIGPVPHADLSRRELECGILAQANLEQTDIARDLMLQHRIDYQDNAAKLFRRQVARQYPMIAPRDPTGNT